MAIVRVEVVFAADGGPADLEITLSGALRLEEFQRLNEQLVNDPRFRPGLALLVDLSALDVSALSDTELEHLTTMVGERDWDYLPAAVALVAPDHETFESARLYRAYLGGSKSNRQLFTNRTDALAWLESRRGK